MLTVEELIEKLQAIPDKTLEVYISDCRTLPAHNAQMEGLEDKDGNKQLIVNIW